MIGIFISGFLQNAKAQFHYQNERARTIIHDIEEQTPFRFLYRDALIANIRLSFTAHDSTLFSKFRQTLRPYNLSINIDSTRNQAIIYQQKERAANEKMITIRGQVVDAATGERLPYATITWQQQHTTRGVTSNESGSFKFVRNLKQDSLDIQCSYVGYSAKTITLGLDQNNDVYDLTFRLQPQRIDGSELIVTGTNSYNNINQHTVNLVDIGTFSPLGESNTLRALQTLPSVSLSPAMSDGLNIRGSTKDGFQVLIDDITIYNQSHLFGLVDSFNADILKRSGFFYDIAPAQFQAPPGGTLSLLTKTGSIQNFSGTAGLSNTSARLSLEGPIKKGHSSWLVSGRTSYMNTVDWVGNSDFIEWGLDVNRNREILDDNLINFESQLVRPHTSEASFYDLHTKIHYETSKGSRIILSGYLGGDDTQLKSDRLYRTFSSTNAENIEERPVTTVNNWQNGAGSLKYQQWISKNIYSNTTLGVSIYETSFSKDDFTYIDIVQAGGSLQSFIFPFENNSVLNEFKVEQQLQLNIDPWLATGGLSYHYYMGEYFEDSFERPGFFTSQDTHRLDGYLQLDYSGIDKLNLFGGLRTHYYTSGRFLRWSPRIKLTLFPDSDLSLSAGFSKNHQFLNKISLSNTVTSDIWILSTHNQPPTSVKYYSGGLYYSSSEKFYFHAEGYRKDFEYIWLHEINAYSLSNSFNENPWLTDNSGTGKGIEFLLQNQFSLFSFTQTFTVSETTLSNPQIDDGASFFADWDRTYRYGATLETAPLTDLKLYLSWIYATGAPNKLATFGAQNNERLGSYRRTDLSAEYHPSLGKTDFTFSFTVFNLFDRQNPWYRELSFVIDQSNAQNQFRSVPVDVYDIGFHPSFNISAHF